MFEKIKLGRASDEVVHQIKEVILYGKLSPGDRLPSERELAERFGLSRMTIRDALRVLESQGLIEIKVGASGGAFVREPNLDIFEESLFTVITTSKTSLLELAEARKIVEAAVVELAVERATETDLKDLREAVRSAGETVNSDRDSHSGLDFHTALARASKNHVLELTVNSFRALFAAALKKLLPNAEMEKRVERDHCQILEAIEARDPVEARRAMDRHLEYFESKVKRLQKKA